jgi:hypothetical protein
MTTSGISAPAASNAASGGADAAHAMPNIATRIDAALLVALLRHANDGNHARTPFIMSISEAARPASSGATAQDHRPAHVERRDVATNSA